jgi:hypothetical protein
VVHSAAAEVRRFPSLWTAEETDACFIVRDANRQALAYIYFEEEPGRRAAAKLLTRDEARRIADNIAKLPELLSKPQTSIDPTSAMTSTPDISPDCAHRRHGPQPDMR